jgi:hypothetical protein
MSNLTWKGPTNALVYQPNSPRLVYGDRVKAVDIYKGVQALCAESMLARGTFGTGFRAGWVVNQCTCDTSRGQVGTLTIDWEAGGSEADQPLPVGDFSLEPQEIYPKIERNAFFGNMVEGGEIVPGSGILPETVRGAYNAMYSFQQDPSKTPQYFLNQSINGSTANVNGVSVTFGGINFASHPNTNANAQYAFGNALVGKLANGEESYYIAGYRYSYDLYSYTEPTLSEGGIIANRLEGDVLQYPNSAQYDLGGPLNAAVPDNQGWLRLADKVEPAGVNGSMYRLTITWLGGPNGLWDPDLYTVG